MCSHNLRRLLRNALFSANCVLLDGNASKNYNRFELEVLAPLDRRVVSNTPVMMSNEETVELPSGRKERRRRWKFAETPVMSTYLLALVSLPLLPLLPLLLFCCRF